MLLSLFPMSGAGVGFHQELSYSKENYDIQLIIKSQNKIKRTRKDAEEKQETEC